MQKTGRSIYSFGWILDIARCIYTLRTGKIIVKTDVVEWALENNLCPDPDALRIALEIRRSLLEHKEDKHLRLCRNACRADTVLCRRTGERFECK